MTDDPDRNLNRFIIRFSDPTIRDRLKEEASRNRRTLTAEIEARLVASLGPTPEAAIELENRLAEIAERLRRLEESGGIPITVKPKAKKTGAA